MLSVASMINNLLLMSYAALILGVVEYLFLEMRRNGEKNNSQSNRS